MRSDRLLNALIAVATVVLCVAAVEAFLVWDNRRPRVEPLRMELAGREFRFWERPEALSDVDDAAFVIGDSFTAGEACADGRNYPSHLDRLMRSHDKGRKPARVVNLGVPGADPFMYLQLVEGMLATERVPAFAVVTLYSNDIEATCSVCRFLERVRQDPAFSADELARLDHLCNRCNKAQHSLGGHHGKLRQVHTWLYKNLNVYGLFRDAVVQISMGFGFNLGWGRSAYPVLWAQEGSTEFKLLKFALAGMRDAFRDAGVSDMMVVIYPDMENLRRDNPYVNLYQQVEHRLSGSLDLPVFSGYPAFLDNPQARGNMIYSIVDHHPSCRAHEIFAHWVFAKLEQVRQARGQDNEPRL